MGKHKFSSVQSLSHVQLFVTPWTIAHQASLSITNYWSLLKLISIVSVMPSNHLILCRPILLPPSIFPWGYMYINNHGASLIAQSVKNLPAMQETQVQFLGCEDSLEKEMATHSSILACRIPWIEEPGGEKSMGLQESDTT